MRSKIAKRIIDETPESVRVEVRKYGDKLVKIPPIGQRFEVSFKAMKYKFEGVILGTKDGLYYIKTFNRIGVDATKRPYAMPDSDIEVEAKWFDTEETGRIIKVKENQLTLL